MKTLSNIFYRIISAWYALRGEVMPVPVRHYKVLAMSDDTIIFSTRGDSDSVEVALWALERPVHYWRASALGQQVKQHVEETMGSLERVNAEEP